MIDSRQSYCKESRVHFSWPTLYMWGFVHLACFLIFPDDLKSGWSTETPGAWSGTMILPICHKLWNKARKCQQTQ